MCSTCLCGRSFSHHKKLSLRNLGAGCRDKRTVISRSTITRCVLVLDFANVAQSTEQDFCVDLTPRSGACRCHLSSDQIIRTGSWKLYTMLAEYCTSYRFAEPSGRFFTRPNEFIVCFISLVFVLVLGASCSISSRYVRRRKHATLSARFVLTCSQTASLGGTSCLRTISPLAPKNAYLLLSRIRVRRLE